MSKNHKKVYMGLKSIELSLTLVSAIPECVSIPAFPSLIGIYSGILNSSSGLKICEINAGIKKYKSIIQKTRKIVTK